MDFLDNDSDDDESQTYQLFGGKEGIVFLIDATEDMFSCEQFSLAIRCIENAMKNKAIASPGDEFAIILFGTDKTSNDYNFDHIFVVQKLQKTSADLIIGLKSLIDCDFDKDLGHNRYSLSDVFSLAISEFTKSKSKFQSKRVILLTCCPQPHDGITAESKHLRKTAINRSKDFKDHNISVELIPLTTKDNKPFDVELFYEDCFPKLKDQNCQTLTKLEPLLKRIHRKTHRQRMVASLPFRLGPKSDEQNDGQQYVEMSVYIYVLCSDTKRPVAVKIDRKDNTELKTVVQRWTADTGALLKNEDLSKKYQFGQRDIVVNKQEVKKMSAFGEEPALSLLGFKPRTAIKLNFQIKTGFFIYPNESHIEGSITLFNALIRRCAERDKVAICRITLRRRANTYLCALFPQLENKYLDKPGGFKALILPFKDDIRDLEIKGAERQPINGEAFDLMKDVIRKLKFIYDPKDFPNPVLQTHWRTIEALALNYDNIEPFDDSQTQPDYDSIESKVGYDLYSLNQLLGAYEVQPIVKKPVKVYDDLKEIARNNKLGSLTVAELQEFCRKKSITADGTRKAQLMEAVHKYYKL
ncbi:X-ray repair cross-complementing protein 6-like [Oppia nitens]|uniref:X-ray repair cross-complementing protein 6-like n=1 Tax=Oppia nitens TaxID=1686743 RepID=UPI0023DB04C0|nr:X-ray repair cross-complementing protein 6-like [Oppia nitens]